MLGEKNKMEKLEKDQLNKLIETLEKYKIKSKWIMKICNVDSLLDITIVQYNYLLLIIEKIFIREKE